MPEKKQSVIEKKFCLEMKNFQEQFQSESIIGRYCVDFYFENHNTVVELDSYEYHSTYENIVYDTIRKRYLQRHSQHVLRFTGREINSGYNYKEDISKSFEITKYKNIFIRFIYTAIDEDKLHLCQLFEKLFKKDFPNLNLNFDYIKYQQDRDCFGKLIKNEREHILAEHLFIDISLCELCSDFDITLKDVKELVLLQYYKNANIDLLEVNKLIVVDTLFLEKEVSLFFKGHTDILDIENISYHKLLGQICNSLHLEGNYLVLNFLKESKGMSINYDNLIFEETDKCKLIVQDNFEPTMLIMPTILDFISSHCAQYQEIILVGDDNGYDLGLQDEQIHKILIKGTTDTSMQNVLSGGKIKYQKSIYPIAASCGLGMHEI